MKKLFKPTLIVAFVVISNIGMSAQPKTIISPDNQNIRYMGRIDFTNPDKPLFAYPNVAIKTKFEGTSIDLLLKDYDGNHFADNYFVSIIDSNTPVKFKVTSGQQVYPVAGGLTDNTHTVEIIKVTESYNGECQFLGFQIDSAKNLVTPDLLPDLKIEFFGNSISCGYGIEGGDQPASDNSYKAYAAVAARELNAQFHTTSYSGIGVVKGFAPFVMNQMYNLTIAVTSYDPLPANNTWDFTRFVPDIAIVSLGTNDYNTGWSSGSITTETFETGYIDLIDKIRSAYPNAHIVCTNSPMVSDAMLGNSISEVVDRFNILGDEKVHYFSFSLMEGGGFNGHPGVADGQTNGKELASYIKTILSQISGVEVDKNNDDFTLYPNPSKNSLQIKSDIKADFIEVSDLEGKVIKTFKIALPGEAAIDISQFKKGIYVFSILDNSNSHIVKKICTL